MRELFSGLWMRVLGTVLFVMPAVFFTFPLAAFCEDPPTSANPKDAQLEDELKYLQEETYVITPARISQRIDKAPGSIYVVTDRRIREMGARYLIDVIDIVPGWFTRQNNQGTSDIFARGSSGHMSDQILIMVNGQTLNEPGTGSAELYEFVDLDNVKRIEFVTGPGSSLYGSGAMSGIINIITKDGKDFDGLQLTGRGGSYHTWEGNALFGKTIEGLEIAAYADYLNTDGFRGHVDKDYQSYLDQRYGTHASLAPGSTRGSADQWDGQLTLKYHGFKFDGKYLGRKRDLPFGRFPTLDHMSESNDRQYYLNLSYDKTIVEGLDLTARVFRNQYLTDYTNQMAPKGALIATPKGPAVLSDDMYYEFQGKSRRTGFETQSSYEFGFSNTLVGGLSFERMEIYDNNTKGNYIPAPLWPVIIPLPSVQDFPQSVQYPNENRDLWALYLEDLWDLTDNLSLTIGARYDHYSDVGGELSPRISMNWNISEHFFSKFLYAKAFRAPTLIELYHPRYGNDHLKPVTRDSYELTFGFKLPPRFEAEICGFYAKSKNYIQTAAANSGIYKYVNYNDPELKGAELRMRYDLGRGSYLSLNYTMIDINIMLDDQYINAWRQPKDYGTLGANIRLNRYLNLNSYLLYRGDWERGSGDTRDAPGDYAIVNAALIARNFSGSFSGMEFRAVVNNLFNKEYVAPEYPAYYLPDDIPMPGINFFLEMRYTF